MIHAGEIEFERPPGGWRALGDGLPGVVGPALAAGFCAEQRFFGNHWRASWQGDVTRLRLAYGWDDGLPTDGWDRLGTFVAEAWNRIDRYVEDIQVVAGALLELRPLSPSDIRVLIGPEGGW